MPLLGMPLLLGTKLQATKLQISTRWDGTRLPEREHAYVTFALGAAELGVEVAAPYYADAPPAAGAGSTDRLWEHEVVELFLADAGERYLEIELGPHGHYLVLELSGVRKPTRMGMDIDFASEIVEQPSVANGLVGRWRGRANVPASYLPQQVCRANAYAVHGNAQARCHHAHAPLPTIAPDFHRLETFVPCLL
jgi:hypothetical protein